jgi:hypothetical protein
LNGEIEYHAFICDMDCNGRCIVFTSDEGKNYLPEPDKCLFGCDANWIPFEKFKEDMKKKKDAIDKCSLELEEFIP